LPTSLLFPYTTLFRSGFAYLQERKIPFIRFALNGYWPNNWDLYLKHPDRFFENLDDFVKAAEHYKIGLIPSFFWHTPTVPDLVADRKSTRLNSSHVKI